MELTFDRHVKVEGEWKAVGLVIPKKWLKHRLGRSPERADAFVFRLFQAAVDDDPLFWA